MDPVLVIAVLALIDALLNLVGVNPVELVKYHPQVLFVVVGVFFFVAIYTEIGSALQNILHILFLR